ncbi:MAG: CHRD domain-containing protein, partial [Fimbriimonadales bacterium]|nr:CHRD domain-containing protein [Fimbriimonadales bacterium]
MKRFYATLAMLFALGTLTLNAQLWTFSGTLTGAQNVPPNDSTATGTVSGTYNQRTKELRISLFGSGFDSDVTFANVHFGRIGENGPNRFFLTRTNSDPRVWESFDIRTLTESEESEFLQGLWYVDIHTQRFPRGEIRTQ